MNMQSAFIFYSLSVLRLIYSVFNLQRPKRKKKKETFLIIPKVIIVQSEHTKRIRQNSKSALWGRTYHVSTLLPKKQCCNMLQCTIMPLCMHPLNSQKKNVFNKLTHYIPLLNVFSNVSNTAWAFS